MGLKRRNYCVALDGDWADEKSRFLLKKRRFFFYEARDFSAHVFHSYDTAYFETIGETVGLKIILLSFSQDGNLHKTVTEQPKRYGNTTGKC